MISERVMMLKTEIALLLLAACLTGCSRGDTTAVPRRTAYPRIDLYDSVYKAVDSVPLRLLVNERTLVSTESRQDGSVWINVDYPSYNAKLYCTITPADTKTIEDVIDNRAERIHRNLGQARAEISEGQNQTGMYYNIVYAPTSTNTPVQFLAVDRVNEDMVMSGTLFFDKAVPAESVDSLRPVYESVMRDVRVMMDSLLVR